jgi:hypothetical protein
MRDSRFKLHLVARLKHEQRPTKKQQSGLFLFIFKVFFTVLVRHLSQLPSGIGKAGKNINMLHCSMPSLPNKSNHAHSD